MKKQAKKQKPKNKTWQRRFVAFMDNLLYIEGDDDDEAVITRRKKKNKQ